MHATALLTSLLFALSTSAVPTKPQDTPYYGVSLHVDTNPPGQPETASPAPVEINQLTSLGPDTYASKLTFDKLAHFNVDVNKVECRAYKDQAGVEPLSGAFNFHKPGVLSTTTVVQVGSVLCYIKGKDVA